MARVMVNDLDYLTARLHGCRSRLAEGERLDALSGLSSLAALGRAIYADTELQATSDFQHRLIHDLIWEISGFLKHLGGAGNDLLAWMLIRFQIENLKVLLRRLMQRMPLETPEEYLLSLPHGLALDMTALAAATSPEKFAELLPSGTLRERLRNAVGIYHDQLRPFFLEAALDQGYFETLLARSERLPGEDRELITPVVFQEVDAFHLMLLIRGKFHYQLSPELLLPLHVPGSGITRGRFNTMLAAPDILSAARLAMGRAIDALPSDHESNEAPATINAAALEALTWNRFLRLSNRAFRRSHLGLGAVVGYVGIRRVEVANLITLSESVRIVPVARVIRTRLIPRTNVEAGHV